MVVMYAWSDETIAPNQRADAKRADVARAEKAVLVRNRMRVISDGVSALVICSDLPFEPRETVLCCVNPVLRSCQVAISIVLVRADRPHRAEYRRQQQLGRKLPLRLLSSTKLLYSLDKQLSRKRDDWIHCATENVSFLSEVFDAWLLRPAGGVR